MFTINEKELLSVNIYLEEHIGAINVQRKEIGSWEFVILLLIKTDTVG